MDSTMSPDKPCNGSNYFLHGHNLPAPNSWRWFHCRNNQKCIHINARCDLHPHSECIYEKDGIMVAEDEEGCFDEYKRKNLVAKTTNIICSSPDHNTMSPAVTHYDDYLKLNFTAISRGTTVQIPGVRCDGIFDCWGGIDEEFCGLNSFQTIGVGKKFKHLEAMKGLLWKIMLFMHKSAFKRTNWQF